MKRRNLAIIIVVLAVITVVSLTACNSLFANDSDPSRYFIEIGEVDDARVASIVANNTIGSCVRVLSKYKGVTDLSASSGFIIAEDGYVLTNRHCVIRYGTSGSDTPMLDSDKPLSAEYNVVFADNISYSASLVAYSNTVDLAVLKISATNLPLITHNKFKPIVLETAHDLYYGERLYTIGNPDNMGLVLTELTVASPALKMNSSATYDSIVLDGNINHGNSGGPILNAYSRVCGIAYAKVGNSSKDVYGLGVAIPTSEIVKFLDSISGAKINYKTTPITSGDAS